MFKYSKGVDFVDKRLKLINNERKSTKILSAKACVFDSGCTHKDSGWCIFIDECKWDNTNCFKLIDVCSYDA